MKRGDIILDCKEDLSSFIEIKQDIHTMIIWIIITIIGNKKRGDCN